MTPLPVLTHLPRQARFDFNCLYLIGFEDDIPGVGVLIHRDDVDRYPLIGEVFPSRLTVPLSPTR
jgi:hypothetical protein